MRIIMSNQNDTSPALRCIGFNVRRTDRVLTQFYDEMLTPSGLSAPQFGLLATIAQAAPVSINHLAETMNMDRTTLTRNLDLLVKQGLVQNGENEDRRVRLVLLTGEGQQALERAWPLWEQAQAHVECALGRERFDALLNELATVRSLVS
jgi:DNA-binding MarR family transcriptional regulator